MAGLEQMSKDQISRYKNVNSRIPVAKYLPSFSVPQGMYF